MRLIGNLGPQQRLNRYEGFQRYLNNIGMIRFSDFVLYNGGGNYTDYTFYRVEKGISFLSSFMQTQGSSFQTAEVFPEGSTKGF